MTVNTQQFIDESRKELRVCLKQREALDQRILELTTAIRALVRFVPEEAHREQILQEVRAAKRKQITLGEAILDLFSRSKEVMNAAQIREKLEQAGFDIEEYSQPIGAVMTAAQRLVDDEKLEKEKTEESGVVFRLRTVKAGDLAKAMAKK